MDTDSDQFARFRLKPGLPGYSLTEQEAAWDDWLECVRVVKGEAAGPGDTWKALGYPTNLRGQGPERR